LIVLDTCVLIFDALTPERLSESARATLDQGESEGTLACCDISLWEIAMLVAKGRLDPGTDCTTFARLALEARGIRVLEITPEIARRSAEIDLPQADPADRRDSDRSWRVPGDRRSPAPRKRFGPYSLVRIPRFVYPRIGAGRTAGRVLTAWDPTPGRVGQ
jgi:PIN domain nuclease of toxin-antitoxin system